MIAARAQRYLAGRKHGFEEAPDVLVRAFEMIEISERDIAYVAHAAYIEGIKTRHMMDRASHARHVADFARAKSRTRTGRDATVERHAGQHDIEFIDIRAVRHAHEGRDATETG